MLGELGISPDESEEMEVEGEAGAWRSSASWYVVETGVVLRSEGAMPVRRRLEGGMLELDGERACFASSRSEISSEAMDERGDPGESIAMVWRVEPTEMREEVKSKGVRE